MLIDLVIYDRPQNRARFAVIYVLGSVLLQTRVRLRTLTRGRRAIYTLVQLFANANWLEREAMDMFGLCFSGHPDLRRILNDYGFWGFPGRRDFPNTGAAELLFSLTEFRVFRLNMTFAGVLSLCLLSFVF